MVDPNFTQGWTDRTQFLCDIECFFIRSATIDLSNLDGMKMLETENNFFTKEDALYERPVSGG